jgi:hypothetical protein
MAGRIGEAPLGEGAVHRLAAQAAVADHGDPVEREANPGDVIQPVGRAVVEAGDDAADGEGDGPTPRNPPPGLLSGRLHAPAARRR